MLFLTLNDNLKTSCALTMSKSFLHRVLGYHKHPDLCLTFYDISAIMALKIEAILSWLYRGKEKRAISQKKFTKKPENIDLLDY
jgi:hypothetical protein